MSISYVKLLMILFIMNIFSYTLKAEVSLDEKIGQMLFVGFSGDRLNTEVKQYLTEYKVGGIILMSSSLHKSRMHNIKNPKQLAKLTEDLQAFVAKEAISPLFIGVDQEGGRVARLRASNGFTDFQSAEELAAKGKDTVYLESKKIAKMLKEYGINVNFAPVVDVNFNSNNPIIAKLKRAYSNSPNKVYEFAEAFVKGHKEEGIITSIKHFPGHGSSKGDTHFGMVDVTRNWKVEELTPFILFIKNKYNDMIMPSHIMNKTLDSKYPASLSYNMITELLYNKLGYQGVVITDSLDMDAIFTYYSLENTVLSAINAGNDILLYANNANRSYNPNIVYNMVRIIKEAVAKGTISEARINHSYQKIMKLKKDFNLLK